MRPSARRLWRTHWALTYLLQKMPCSGFALDTLVVKEVFERAGIVARWVPASLQLADALTKDQAGACDLLRATMQSASYTIADELQTLHKRAEEKTRRLKRGEERARQAERLTTEATTTGTPSD